MKCAVVICGKCLMSGYRICTDEYILTFDQVKELPYFGKLARDRTDELKPI